MESTYTMSDTCERCGATYVPLMQAGLWQCCRHPGDLVHRRWTCCGRVYSAQGCSRCDHGPPRPPIAAQLVFCAQLDKAQCEHVRAPGLCLKSWQFYHSPEALAHAEERDHAQAS